MNIIKIIVKRQHRVSPNQIVKTNPCIGISKQIRDVRQTLFIGNILCDTFADKAVLRLLISLPVGNVLVSKTGSRMEQIFIVISDRLYPERGQPDQ